MTLSQQSASPSLEPSEKKWKGPIISFHTFHLDIYSFHSSARHSRGQRIVLVPPSSITSPILGIWAGISVTVHAHLLKIYFSPLEVNFCNIGWCHNLNHLVPPPLPPQGRKLQAQIWLATKARQHLWICAYVGCLCLIVIVVLKVQGSSPGQYLILLVYFAWTCFICPEWWDGLKTERN